jgi:nucleotide-binding universal stress UspA family protein
MARVELLDVGSNKGRALKANAEQALRDLGLAYTIEEVGDISALLAYGISGIPALAIDGKVVLQQAVPSVPELRVVLSTLLQPVRVKYNIKHIVAPTDFSGIASNALAYAKSMAAVQEASLQVVHIHSGGIIPMERDEYSAEAKLQAFIDMPVSTNGYDSSRVLVQTEMITGSVVEELRRISKLPQTDIMVMGATGHNTLLNRMFGSVSSEVARLSACPVLLVPGNARFRGFRQIIIAGNYTLQADSVLPRLMELARLFNSEIHYVHVNANTDEIYRVHKTLLEPMQQHGEGRQTITEMTTIDSRDIVEGLNRYALERAADLIVMSTTQRSYVEALFHRSLTRQAVLHIHIPLLIMHTAD